MSNDPGRTALLTFSIGPVHTFIAQARRVADLWAGSAVLSALITAAIERLREEPDTALVFPFLEAGEEIPPGLPNRFVCRVPAQRASALAGELERAVRRAWRGYAALAVELLRERYGFSIGAPLWRGTGRPSQPDQVDAALSCSWSWVPEEGGYATASPAGARQFVASRLYRPFVSIEEPGEKCAICGERAALPDGVREHVHQAWKEAEERARTTEAGFFRFDQTRLCLVCATKRFFPQARGETARFRAFDAFEPPLEEERGGEKAPYVALVEMDGDRMGRILSWSADEVEGGDVEGFHRRVSRVLSSFAHSLRTPGSQNLNLATLGWALPLGHTPPQLIYAGGDDVRFVCDPRHALPLASRVAQLYRCRFADEVAPHVVPGRRGAFTISAGILIAHTKHPAGQMFRDVAALLEHQAKGAAGRDAVAVRLSKRGGAPEEVAFRWAEPAPGAGSWIEQLDALVERLRDPSLASRQTFNLRREEHTLTRVFGRNAEQWQRWLADRLSRGEVSAGQAEPLAEALTQFFVHGKTSALRIARFLGVEVGR